MTTEETIFRSLLDKPLGKLTEDDISQLTREDCRKYLKEKGMRRPSWNKSQAIEQVISLKTLLEATTESDTTTGFRRKIHVPPPENSSHVSSKSLTVSVPLSSENVTCSDFPIPGSVNEAVSYRRKDPPQTKPGVSCGVSCLLPVSDDNNASPRNMSAVNELVGQMTIFYCGKVNIYDDIPADKARTIMQLATSHIPLVPDAPTTGTATVRSFACRLQGPTNRPGGASPSPAVSPIIQTAVAENIQQCREEGKLSRDLEPGTGFHPLSFF